MSKIKILPENLANQIAAGEVIERPASVVKEFVENAIDAGAQNISIQIEGDGSRLIRVVDDGVGMQEDDVLLSLERHATSKLESSEQLSSIHTLGFRGEAIPSIASVSKLTITSRPHDAELGSRVEIRFGKIFKVHDMGCPPGTVMEVKDLFGNMPARKKFLKSRQTEISHIDEIIKNYALVQPKLGFYCDIQGRAPLHFPAQDGGLERRVRQIVCRADSEALVDLSGNEKQSDIVVSGYLVAPENSTGGTGGLRVFVNGRAVKDRGISHAVSEGLHNFLLKGKRARGVVFVTLPSLDVDVNVHPTKQEIRFHRSQKVHEVVVDSVRLGMRHYQKTVRHEIFGNLSDNLDSKEAEQKGEKDFEADSGIKEKLFWEEKKPTNYTITSVGDAPIAGNEVKEPHPLSFSVAQPPQVISQKNVERDQEGKFKESVQNKAATKLTLESKEEAAHLPGIGTMRYVGQLFNSYLLCETETGFAVVDQHAAQERLVFEELCKQYTDSKIPSQALLFPEIIELSPTDREILEQNGEEISRMGLEVKEFGGTSFIVQGVPAALSHLGPGEIVEGTLTRFSEGGDKGSSARLEHVLAGMACKASVKAGRKLFSEEVETLLRQMSEAGIFSHCPHGRPVVKSFSKDDVKKWFLRT